MPVCGRVGSTISYPPVEVSVQLGWDGPLSNPPLTMIFEQAPGVGVFVGGGGTGVFVRVGVGVLVAPGGGVFVGIGVLVGGGGTGVLVGVGGTPPQPGNLNAPIRVCQLAPPVVWMYSVVIQKVQSSEGSTDIIA